MALWILRAVFLLVAAGVGFALTGADEFQKAAWVVFPIVMAAAVVLIIVDVLTVRKRIEIISSIYIGIVVGIFLTYVVRMAILPLFPDPNTRVLNHILWAIGIGVCYICISILMQTKDDFRFIIPYVEFAKEVKGLKPYVLDTSVVIDGRIADLVETGVLDNQLIMPRFILNELHGIADSSEKMRRSRGRRGLDVLNRLRSNKHVDLKFYDRELKEMAGQSVDMKLVLLAKFLDGKIVTGDYNLNKVARLHNVPVINLNDIANALKPIFLPGEHVEVSIVRPGEEPGQGVGYLDDGTMIVVEGGRDYVNQTVRIVVTSVLQTSAGRMIFGRFEQVLSGNRSRETVAQKS